MKNDDVAAISERFSVVAIGDFNPAIFQPYWLAKNNLIRIQEAEETTVKLISKDVSILEGPWFMLQVTQERFAFDSLDPVQNNSARDFVIGVFSILEHTPIRALGLNLVKRFEFSDETTWHQFGDHFAPKSTWNKIIEKAGLLELTVVGNVIYKNSNQEEVPARIEIQSWKKCGVQVSVNHHFDFLERFSQEDRTAGKRIEVVSRNYDHFFEHVGKIIETLFSDFSQTPKRQ